jgi:very-short-patch-repair endonuclease
MSSYELYILKVLQRGNTVFEREKTFDDLRNGKYRFDFYLPNWRGRDVLIEIDGEQHFQQVRHFQKTRTDFKKTQEHDRRKNAYALSHDYLLIRIPYWRVNEIISVDDMFNPDFIVKSKFHNDDIKAPSL